MSLKSLDIIHGRQGGRRVDPGRIIPGIDDVPTAAAICAHGHRWRVAEREIGRSCFHCAHALRRVKPADAGRPVIVVVHVPPEPCPCGTAA